MAISPYLEHGQISLLAEQKSHVSNVLEEKSTEIFNMMITRLQNPRYAALHSNKKMFCLTMSPKHPVLCIMGEGNTCGFQFLHKGVVESGRLDSTAIQNGLRQNKPLWFCLTALSALPFHLLNKCYINVFM